MAKNFSLNQCALLPAEVDPVLEAEFPMVAVSNRLIIMKVF